MKATRMRVYNNFGKNNPMFGKKHTEDTKNKISIANTGKTAWNKGKKMTKKYLLSILKRKKKHGMCGTREYNSWKSMMGRCYNKNNNAYNNYGARGITTCEEWKDFINFYKDMGKRPEGKSIDRINNNKGYYKENCRWATPKEQSINQRHENKGRKNGNKNSISFTAM